MTTDPAPLPADEAALLCAIADELRNAGDTLEVLATALALEPIVANRHLQSLQSLDLLTQTIRECATVLQAALDMQARRDALMAIGLADLKQRLSCYSPES
mgnify:CR=1 FL=1|jgi:hypothetical protein